MELEHVVLKYRRGSDIVCAVAGLALAPLLLWMGLIQIWTMAPHDFVEARRGAIFGLILQQFGPWPLVLGFTIFGLYMLSMAVGGGWRMIDRRPVVDADASGIRFHPSVHFGPLSWREIRAIRLEEGSSSRLRIETQRRFWSPMAWYTSNAIAMDIKMLGLSQEKAQETVKKLRQWLPA